MSVAKKKSFSTADTSSQSLLSLSNSEVCETSIIDGIGPVRDQNAQDDAAIAAVAPILGEIDNSQKYGVGNTDYDALKAMKKNYH